MDEDRTEPQDTGAEPESVATDGEAEPEEAASQKPEPTWQEQIPENLREKIIRDTPEETAIAAVQMYAEAEKRMHEITQEQTRSEIEGILHPEEPEQVPAQAAPTTPPTPQVPATPSPTGDLHAELAKISTADPAELLRKQAEAIETFVKAHVMTPDKVKAATKQELDTLVEKATLENQKVADKKFLNEHPELLQNREAAKQWATMVADKGYDREDAFLLVNMQSNVKSIQDKAVKDEEKRKALAETATGMSPTPPQAESSGDDWTQNPAKAREGFRGGAVDY